VVQPQVENYKIQTIFDLVKMKMRRKLIQKIQCPILRTWKNQLL